MVKFISSDTGVALGKDFCDFCRSAVSIATKSKSILSCNTYVKFVNEIILTLEKEYQLYLDFVGNSDWKITDNSNNPKVIINDSINSLKELIGDK